MAKITVSYELKDDDNNVIQTGSQLFDLNNPDLIGEVGTHLFVLYDKTDEVVDGVGGRPRNRQSPNG